MLSMHDDEQFFFEALKAGAHGYVLKSAADQDLVAACRAAVHGDTYMYPAASRRADQRLPQPADGRAPAPGTAVAPASWRSSSSSRRDSSAREIAERLVISERTVDRHRSNILEKLHLKDRLDLARYAIRRGLIDA